MHEGQLQEFLRLLRRGGDFQMDSGRSFNGRPADYFRRASSSRKVRWLRLILNRRMAKESSQRDTVGLSQHSLTMAQTLKSSIRQRRVIRGRCEFLQSSDRETFWHARRAGFTTTILGLLVNARANTGGLKPWS